MGLRENIVGPKEKSSDEKEAPVGHNAEATKTGKKNRITTTYVNICNHSTPDIVAMRWETTYILRAVDIIKRTLIMTKSHKNSKNK